MEPYFGAAVIHEDDLILVDRALSVGDVVKRCVGDIESGTIVQQTVGHDLRSVLSPNPQSSLWSREGPRNEIFSIPGEELTLANDFEIGDYIIFQETWLGIITDVMEEVTIRLDNGSIVTIFQLEDLGVEDPTGGAELRSGASGNQSLATVLRERFRSTRASWEAGKGKKVEAEYYYAGRKVFTKKANLRLGRWIFGAYDPAVEPRGTVVNVSTYQITVDWMTSNVFDVRAAAAPQPNEILTTDDFSQVVIYNRNLNPSTNAQFGTRHCIELGLGEFVRFKDLSGAAVKYSDAQSPHGKLKRIPRSSTNGYDMNVFTIVMTKTKVTVQWQDGSRTTHESNDLLPYLNVDEHDLWPGEIVAMRDEQKSDLINGSDVLQTLVKPPRVGVVQTANARERIVDVRWFREPSISIFGGQHTLLLPGSHLGPLSEESSQVSVYEVVAHPALTKRRGDLVLVSANEALVAAHQEQVLLSASPESVALRLPNTAPSREALEHDPDGLGSSPGPAWFGEVVDLGLDGLLTIRLGALEKIRDVRVSIERVITVVNGDDDSLMDDSLADSLEGWEDEMSIDAESEATSYMDSDEALEEVVEYEGGARLDNDGEEVWTTDDDDMDQPRTQTQPDRKASNLRTEEVSEKTLDTTLTAPTNFEDHEDLHLSTYANLPPQFSILDEPVPVNHRFVGSSVRLTSPLLRRIRKEHGILASSLPEGVWVRTWDERLDLLRILIVGARDTPYELAPFVMDFQFQDDFPTQPPQAYFHSWTHGVGRINPNLYEDGKCCLSLLGTWDSDTKNEGWSIDSSMLQVVVSLLGLVLVKEPYYSTFRPIFAYLFSAFPHMMT